MCKSALSWSHTQESTWYSNVPFKSSWTSLGALLKMTNVLSEITPCCSQAPQLHAIVSGTPRPGDIGRKEGINGDASGQAATDVPGPGEELSTWWARVMGLEKFIPSSTRRHVLTYGHLPDLRLTCDPTSRVHGQEAVIYSLQS